MVRLIDGRKGRVPEDPRNGDEAGQSCERRTAGGLGDRRVLLGVALCILAGAWIALGNVHRCQHSDSLLPVLVSLYKWTPFYWEQDRYGMLLPLLATPVRSPFWNLLVQSWLSASGTLIGIMLLARYLLAGRHWPAVAALAVCLFSAFDPPGFRFEVLIGQPYGLSLGLAMTGLWIAEGRSRPWGSAPVVVGQALVILAHWVNFSCFVFLFALSVLRIVLDRPDPPSPSPGGGLFRFRIGGRSLKDPLLIAVGAVIGLIALTTSSEHWTRMGGVPFGEWPRAWTALLGSALTVAGRGSGLWTRGLLLVGAGCAILFPERTKCLPHDLRVSMGLFLVGAAVVLVTGTRDWVRINDYHFRYLILALLAWQVAAAVFILTPIIAHIGPRRPPFYAAGSAAVAASFFLGFGTPDPAAVRGDLDRLLGSRTKDVLDAECTHVAGSYWTVWTTVYHTNLVLYERGVDRVVWGISHRSKPTRDRWSAVDEKVMRIGVPKGDEEADRYLAQYGFPPMTTVEVRESIRVLRPRAVVESEGGEGARSQPG